MIIFALMVSMLVSCADRSVKEVWLSKNIEWKKSETGLSEIDTMRTEAYGDIAVVYGDKIVTGTISLYRNNRTDSISIAYEAGKILFNPANCESIKGEGLQESDALTHNKKTYTQTNYMDHNSVNALAAELKKFCW